MKRLISVIVFILISAAVFVYLYRVGYLAQPSALTQLLPQHTATPSSKSPITTTTQVVVTGLEVPWSIVWTDDCRMLIAERPGRIRIFDGELQPVPLLTIANVATGDEEGLMGLAIDPDYQQNRFIYYCYAYDEGSELFDRVVRAVDEGDHVSNTQTLLEDIPAAPFHAGCRIAFGPDDKLYITTGDATTKEIAQDLESLGGKILRINSDGSIPSDNPTPNSPIWSYGHRNPQGIAWEPITNRLFETEHGPSGFDGPGGGDEINLIQRGGNYGWPIVSHSQHKDGMIDPLITYTPAQAPAAAAFYSGTKIPQFTGKFFFGALKGERLHMIHFSDDSPPMIKSKEVVAEGYGRIRAVAEGPDGYLYFSTSNQDGRGTPQEGDDRILRIVPAE